MKASEVILFIYERESFAFVQSDDWRPLSKLILNSFPSRRIMNKG